LHGQGEDAEVEKLYREALAIRQKALPAGHPDLATGLVSLTLSLHAQGKYAEALEPCQRASQAFEVARLHAAPSGADRAQFAASHAAPGDLLATLLARLKRPHRAWQAAEAGLARGLLDDLTPLARDDLTPAEKDRVRKANAELAVLARQILQAH